MNGFQRIQINQIRHILISLVFLLLLTACFGGGGEEAVPEEQPADQPPQAILTCSDMCAGQGQCGSAPDGRILILGRTEGPETRNHNQLFPIDTPVTILNRTEQKLRIPADGQESNQVFAEIIVNGSEQQGWVAEWCVAPTP
ncbi:MAG: hypothetical protein GY796_19980 [Chloroflexi bacterium]|nr:hypothetical protein [Chloroflexota bacterium]